MQRILITGANSYIGTAVEQYLLKTPKQYLIDTIDTKGLLPNPHMFEGYDVVFHVTGVAHIKETNKNKDLYFKVNRDLTISIAKAAKLGGVKLFIALSSMNVYGKTVGFITKETDPNPQSAYGLSKKEADDFLANEENDEFKVAIIRPPMVYGKNCKGNYQKLRKLALTVPVFPNYKNKRSLIFIGNLCEFVKNIIDEKKNGLFFPQNADYVCTSEMVKKIAECNGKKSYQLSIFNEIIKRMSFSVIKKMFGDLTYEKVDLVDKYGFEESIMLSESRGK